MPRHISTFDKDMKSFNQPPWYPSFKMATTLKYVSLTGMLFTLASIPVLLSQPHLDNPVLISPSFLFFTYWSAVQAEQAVGANRE